MKAPIGRTGGKSRLKNQLIELFPKDYDTFVEPFVGAGNIFYSTPRVKNEIINDLDTDMYIIHTGLQQQPEFINDNIVRYFSKTEFDKAKNKTDPASVMYKYKTSFFRQGRNYDKAVDGKKIAMDFTQFKDRLTDVTILNKDFSDVIKEYDSPTTFFYLDPPYECAKSQSYYKSVSPNDVYNSLQDIQGKFMLSYNDSPNIRKVFSKYNINELNHKYASRKSSSCIKVCELVITNYF
jgi:DNA adenine methylase